MIRKFSATTTNRPFHLYMGKECSICGKTSGIALLEEKIGDVLNYDQFIKIPLCLSCIDTVTEWEEAGLLLIVKIIKFKKIHCEDENKEGCSDSR